MSTLSQRAGSSVIMALEMRPITMEEFATYARAGSAAFGTRPSDEQVERYRGTFEPDRSLAVFDDGQIVATAGALSLRLTVPGGAQVPVAGVTSVGVVPTHR